MSGVVEGGRQEGKVDVLEREVERREAHLYRPGKGANAGARAPWATSTATAPRLSRK